MARIKLSSKIKISLFSTDNKRAVFYIHKVRAEGGSFICYDATLDDGDKKINGLLKEFYPNNIYFKERDKDNLLSSSLCSKRAWNNFCKSKVAFKKKYLKLSQLISGFDESSFDESSDPKKMIRFNLGKLFHNNTVDKGTYYLWCRDSKVEVLDKYLQQMSICRRENSDFKKNKNKNSEYPLQAKFEADYEEYLNETYGELEIADTGIDDCEDFMTKQEDEGYWNYDGAINAYSKAFEVINIIRLLCKASKFLHKQGYVIRDIKPSNLGFCNSRNEYAFVEFFDLDSVCEAGFKKEKRVISKGFTEPEALSQSVYAPTVQTDIYSIGCCLLYWMCEANTYSAITNNLNPCNNAVNSDEAVINYFNNDEFWSQYYCEKIDESCSNCTLVEIWEKFNKNLQDKDDSRNDFSENWASNNDISFQQDIMDLDPSEGIPIDSDLDFVKSYFPLELLVFVICKCLRPRESRYQSVDELENDIDFIARKILSLIDKQNAEDEDEVNADIPFSEVRHYEPWWYWYFLQWNYNKETTVDMKQFAKYNNRYKRYLSTYIKGTSNRTKDQVSFDFFTDYFPS